MTCTSGASAAILTRCLAMSALPICEPQSARTFCEKFASSWPATSTFITLRFSSSWRCARWRMDASYPSASCTSIEVTHTDAELTGRTPENDFQLVGFENAGNLIPRVHCPGTCTVQLEINLPVRKGLSQLAQTLMGKGKIVVGVGVGRRQLDGGGVSGHRFGDATRLIENVAKVEVGQSIAGIGGHGLTVMLLALHKVLPVVIQSAEIDVRRSVIGIEFEHLQVSADGVVVCAGVSFQGNAMREQL